MPRKLVYFLLGLTILTVSTCLSIIFIPPVGRYILAEASLYYLGHGLDIMHYRITPNSISLDGVFDENSTIRIDGERLLTPERRLQAVFAGNTTLFNTLVGTELPAVDFNMTAEYAAGMLNIDTRLLGGRLLAEFIPKTSAYTYFFEGLSLARLFQTFQLPLYATGSLSGSGDGIAVTPYSFTSTVKSYNIKGENALFALPGVTAFGPLSEINVSNVLTYDSGRFFHDDLQVATPQFSFDLNKTKFDLSEKSFSFSSRFSNKKLNEIPLYALNAFGSGHVREQHVSGDFTIDADGYSVNLFNTDYDGKDKTLFSDFNVTTRSTRPYNLKGSNTLYGNLTYKDEAFSAKVAVRGMTGPLQFRYQSSSAMVISNNIPLEILASILNQPQKLKGSVGLNGTIDFKEAYPAVTLKLDANKLIPSEPLATELNMTEPGVVSVLLRGQKGLYDIDLDADSPLLRDVKLHGRYDVPGKQAHIDGKIKKIHLPWYRTNDVQLRMNADLSKRVLTGISIASPYETFTLSEVELSNSMDIALNYRLGALERFIPDANQSAEVTGHANIQLDTNRTNVRTTVERIGFFDFYMSAGTQRFTVSDANLKNIAAILDRPIPVDGNVSLFVTRDNAHTTGRLHTDRLVPSPELNTTLRPFPLDANLTLISNGLQRFTAEATLRTGNDSLAFPSVTLDLSRKYLEAVFRIDLDDLSRSALVIPQGFVGNALSLQGRMQLTPARQLFHTRTTQLELDRHIHRMLDKNASAALPLTIDINASRTAHVLDINASAATDLFTISPLQVIFNRESALLTLQTMINTDLGLGNTSVEFNGTIDGGDSISDGRLHLKARADELEVARLRVNPSKRDVDAEIKLALSPLGAPSAEKRATVYATVHTLPEINVKLRTESFEGNLSAVMNDNLMIIHAAGLSLPQLLQFASKAPTVTQGTLSGNVIFNSQPFLDGNLSRLTGGIDIRTRNLRVEGIDIDDYLNTLRQTQDLSLFQGSLSQLPIVRSVKTLPGDMFTEKTIRTDIVQGRFGAAVKNGMLVCEDCAAATPVNRVAFAGNINLATKRFDHFYAALINPQGCPYFMQRINGSLSDPKINLAESGVKVIGGAVVSLASNVTDAANWLTGVIYRVTSETGKALNYVPIAGKPADKAINRVSGTLHDATTTQCMPFYIGEVPPPVEK